MTHIRHTTLGHGAPPYSVSTLLSSCSSTVEVGVDTVSSGAVFIGNEEAVESDKLESDGCLVVQ